MNVKVQVASDKLKGLLKPEDVNIALRDAVNKTTTTFVARSARAISEVINLNVGDIKKSFRVEKATGKDPLAEVIVDRGLGVPLIEYMSGAQIASGKKEPAGGIHVRVRKGGAIETHQHSFIATMPSGHVGIFRRGSKSGYVSGSKRLPIIEERGPTPIGVLVNSPDPNTSGTILEATVKDSSEVLIKNIESQVDRFLAKYASE